jgi:hypothetical protein
VSLIESPFIAHNTNEIMPSEAEWNLLNPLEDIVMIGYTNGLWDEVNNTPIARRGITATHPKLNYYNEREFLIDILIYPGTSGAPVFAYSYGTFPEPEGATSIGSRLKLLGILFKWAKYNTSGGVVTLYIPTHDRPVVESCLFMSNLGRVIKSTGYKDLNQFLKSLTDEQKK